MRGLDIRHFFDLIGKGIHLLHNDDQNPVGEVQSL